MKSNHIDISIVIRTKNEEKYAEKTLKQISTQDYGGNYEIIIVDSGSEDKTVDLVSRFPVRLHSIKKEPFSYGYALNYGRNVSKGEIIIFLSAHCIPVDSKWLINLVSPLIKDKGVGATYGKQIPIKGINPIEEFELNIFYPTDSLSPKAIFSNANCAIRKDILEKFPFNEDIIYGEDFLWRKKLPKDVDIIYVKDAKVYHSHPNSFNYWRNRHQKIGIATKYLEKVEGIYDFYGRKGNWLIKIFSRLSYMIFFLKRRYFKALFGFPALEIMRTISYIRGLAIGEKMYNAEKSNYCIKNRWHSGINK